MRAEQRRQEILARSRFGEGSGISYKSELSCRKSYSGTGPDVAAIFGRSKKVDNQVAASQSGETDMGLGAAGGASHSLEPLRVITRDGTAFSEPWGSKTILNHNISNPIAQPETVCLLPSAATSPFTQERPPVHGRYSLSAGGAGRGSVPVGVRVPPGFECGFAQGSRPSKVLPQWRANCHVSGRVRNVNDVVVSCYPQRGDIRVGFKPVSTTREEATNPRRITRRLSK